ncbi:hypothetical protein OC835_007397 [Tilletia horrida]|nr:hypothetical protein OC835_007397 [Tilletia horrida]
MPPKTKDDTGPTREEFLALDSARAKLDDDVKQLRTTVQSNSTDLQAINQQLGTLRQSMDGITSFLQRHSPTQPPAIDSGVTARSSSDGLGPSLLTASASAPSTVSPTNATAVTAQPSNDGNTLHGKATDDDRGRHFTIKPEELGTFDGQVEATALFLSHVEALRHAETDPGWDRAILRALPRTLRGSARLWFSALTTEEQKSYLQSLPAFIAQINETFKPPLSVIRRQARDRMWKPDEEDLVHYSFAKVALLKAGWPMLKEDDLLHDVVEGIIPSLAKQLQTPFRATLSLSALRKEMRAQEAFWRQEHNRPLKNPQSADDANADGQYDTAALLNLQTSNSVAVVPATAALSQAGRTGNDFNARRSRSIRDDFDPARLKYRIHPDTKKTMMTYSVPGTNRIMWCARPCRICQGDHFDFAHEHCQQHQVANAFSFDAAEDYPCTVEDALELDPSGF